MQMWALLLSVVALAGCAVSDEDPKAEQIKVALPTEQTLPIGVNTDCECVEGDKCVTLEERAGNFEVKNLSCKWTNTTNEAECGYEARFVALYPNKAGKLENTPENWYKQTVVARHLGKGSWCVAEIKV